MKSIIISTSLLFMFFFPRIHGQADRIIDTTKLWSIAVLPYQNLHYSGFYLKITEDTAHVDNMIYKQVKISTEAEHSEWNNYGLIREDDNGNVYYRINKNSEEGLIYSLNVNRGDIVNVAFRLDDHLSFHEMEVIGVDTIVLNGKSFKRIDFGKDKWIEGIGALSGLLFTYTGITGSDSYELLCFFKNDTLIYHKNEIFGMPVNDCFANDTTTMTKEWNLSNYRIYPNPIHNNRTVISGLDDQYCYNIAIYNLIGHCVSEVNVCHKSEYQLLIDNVKPGIYFLTIMNDHNSSFNKRIIIE